MQAKKENGNNPGECIAWEEQKKQMPEILGDEQIVKDDWQKNDALAYTFIWQMVVSF